MPDFDKDPRTKAEGFPKGTFFRRLTTTNREVFLKDEIGIFAHGDIKIQYALRRMSARSRSDRRIYEMSLLVPRDTEELT